MASAQSALFIGIDCGTSGVRALAIDADRQTIGQGSAAMAGFGDDLHQPNVWLAAMAAALTKLTAAIDLSAVRAIAIDGTSGTMLPVAENGDPLGAALMYNDPVTDTGILKPIADIAPATSAVHGATSALARLISLQQGRGITKILHQADWLAGQFSSRFDISDENNALKTGYDSVAGRWPEWMDKAGANTGLLPQIVAPGTVTGQITEPAAERFGLPNDVQIVAGTTDGCASFLATGASQAGDAVTALGTTLTVKMLTDVPLFAPEFGLYSHRMGDRWLAGGASNSGGNVLLHFFDAARIDALSQSIDPKRDGGLDYYPLTKPGERFPINDPAFPGKIDPRPCDDAVFLHALLEGIADVEELAYQRLTELGAPPLRSIRTVGGGAKNPTWSAIRQRKLGVPFESMLSGEAAFGTALLAHQALRDEVTG